MRNFKTTLVPLLLFSLCMSIQFITITTIGLQLHYRVEWYRTCIRFLKTGTMLPIRYIFLSPIPKIREFIPARTTKFLLSKRHRDLEIEYFVKICKFFPFTSKNKWLNWTFAINFFLMFWGPQNGQICFWACQRKTVFLVFFMFSF